MKSPQTLLLGTVLAAAAQLASAAAVVLDFDAVAGYRLPQTEDGFKVTGSVNWWETMVGNSANCLPSCPNAVGKYVLSFNSMVTVAAVDGGLFSLLSFQGAETWVGHPEAWAKRIHVLGTQLGGSQVSADFALDFVNDGNGSGADFQQFVLPAQFINLSSVQFSGVGSNYNSFALDNLSVSEGQGMQRPNSLNGPNGNAVPEPGSLLLAGLALAGLAGSCRRKA